jgi:hypothetical protein
MESEYSLPCSQKPAKGPVQRFVIYWFYGKELLARKFEGHPLSTVRDSNPPYLRPSSAT